MLSSRDRSVSFYQNSSVWLVYIYIYIFFFFFFRLTSDEGHHRVEINL